MDFKIKSNAKINVGLNVVGVLPNGYHLLDMVMLPISLCDIISGTIENISGDMELTTNNKNIPTDNNNILYKVYEAFYNYISLPKKKIKLHLEKYIPSEAGLGGGSSNGAFLLKLLNEFEGNLLTLEELANIGASIGADISFFIYNRPARVRGIGEKLEFIENNLSAKVGIIKPNFGVSTRIAYENMKNYTPCKQNIDNIVLGLKNDDIDIVEKNIINDLEKSLLKNDENILTFKRYLWENYDNKFFMSGSGSAYYTLIDNNKKRQQCIGDCKIYDFL